MADDVQREADQPQSPQSDESLHESEPVENAASQESQSDWDKLVAERDHYIEMAKRSRADFENYQKRMLRDLQTERKYALQPLLGDLLPVLDNLDRALEAAGGDFSGPARGLLDGIKMVKKQWLDALDKHGVVAIKPDGEPFDPNHHEAVMQQPSDLPPMSVVHTVQTGYRLHDRVIRPAQVIVSCGPADQAGEPPTESQSEANDGES